MKKGEDEVFKRRTTEMNTKKLKGHDFLICINDVASFRCDFGNLMKCNNLFGNMGF